MSIKSMSSLYLYSVQNSNILPTNTPSITPRLRRSVSFRLVVMSDSFVNADNCLAVDRPWCRKRATYRLSINRVLCSCLVIFTSLDKLNHNRINHSPTRLERTFGIVLDHYSILIKYFLTECNCLFILPE